MKNLAIMAGFNTISISHSGLLFWATLYIVDEPTDVHSDSLYCWTRLFRPVCTAFEHRRRLSGDTGAL